MVETPRKVTTADDIEVEEGNPFVYAARDAGIVIEPARTLSNYEWLTEIV